MDKPPLQPLFVDLYADDVGGRPPDVHTLALDRRFNGIILKATEGNYYRPQWFLDSWPAPKHVDGAGRLYGEDWFRGAYHFLKFNLPGHDQADYYLSAVERAGGWNHGDLWPIVDVELGGDKNSNHQATEQQVVDCVGAFAKAVKAKTGRQVMLYGNGAMRDLGIKNRMGCDWIWVPRYTPTLPTWVYSRSGWAEEQLFAWQYCGDGVAGLTGYPTTAPGIGRCDISVMVLPGGLPALKDKLWLKPH